MDDIGFLYCRTWLKNCLGVTFKIFSGYILAEMQTWTAVTGLVDASIWYVAYDMYKSEHVLWFFLCHLKGFLGNGVLKIQTINTLHCSFTMPKNKFQFPSLNFTLQHFQPIEGFVLSLLHIPLHCLIAFCICSAFSRKVKVKEQDGHQDSKCCQQISSLQNDSDTTLRK